MIFYTFEGKVEFPDSAPSIKSIAVSLAREARYAGASLHWWPVALHTFVVCDLLPPELKIHGLLHDASESVTGDIPKPAKSTEISLLEDRLQDAIYRELGINPCFDRKAVHDADVRALHGEVYTVGTKSLRAIYPRDSEAEKLVMKYFKFYSPLDCINPNGFCVMEFLRRFKEYKKWIL